MSNTITVSWTIEKAKINTIPTQNGSITYDGSTKVPSWSNYNSNALKITGTTSAIEAGVYNVEFEPTSNYTWWDGSTGKKQASWVLGNAMIATLPYQNGMCYYTGSVQAPSWNSYNSNALTIGGQTQGTNVNVYTATFTPKVNYQWWDGSTSAKTVSWSIERASISVLPSQNGTLTYNQNTLSPTWNNYNTSQLTIGGTTSAKNAGVYAANFTPTSNYKWQDGATNSKTVNWRINKASVAIDVDKTNLTLKVGETDSVKVSWTGGAINQSSFICTGNNYTNIVWDNAYLKVTGRAKGTDTLKVYLSESDNYLASSNYKNINVIVKNVWTWGDENAVGDADWWDGLADYISEKDKTIDLASFVGKTKKLTLTGSVNELTLNQYNSNTLLVQAVDTGYYTSHYPCLYFVTKNIYGQTSYMDSNTALNYANSKIRRVCNNFYNVMPSYAKNHVVQVQNYTTQYNGNIITTSDYVWVPSAKELGLTVYNQNGSINNNIGGLDTYSFNYFTVDFTRKKKLGDAAPDYYSGNLYLTRANGNTSNSNANTSITIACIDSGTGARSTYINNSAGTLGFIAGFVYGGS